MAREFKIQAFTLSYHSSSSGPCINVCPWYAFGQWPATNTVEDLTRECEAGVEATGGVLLLQTSGVTAEHERWLRPQPLFHRTHLRTDVLRRANVSSSQSQGSCCRSSMSLGLPLASLFRLRSARLIIGAGGAWISMEAYCETTDEQVINVVAIQQFQELAEVWRKTHHQSSFSAEPAYAGDGDVMWCRSLSRYPLSNSAAGD